MENKSVGVWEWDEWQKQVLDHEGNITLRTGRQVGKSEVVGAKACRFALDNGGVVGCSAHCMVELQK